MALADIPFIVAQVGGRTRQSVQTRQLVIQILYWYEGLKQNDIADLLHCQQSTVSRLMKNHQICREKDPNYEAQFQKYRNRYEYALKQVS